MTINEMEKVINEYCESKQKSDRACDDCKIERLCAFVDGEFDINEKECRKAYEIITGTVEHDGCIGCKYNNKEPDELPCSHCRGTIIPVNPLYSKCADFYEPEEPKEPENPYWEKICKIADKQRSKGINKYGKGLEYNPADAIARINHLQEELIDGLMYCEWIKEKLTEGEKA